MITYEVTINCDRCTEKVTGEASLEWPDARGKAKRTAAFRGWQIKDAIHLCTACNQRSLSEIGKPGTRNPEPATKAL